MAGKKKTDGAPEAPVVEAPKVPAGVPLSDGCYVTEVRVYPVEGSRSNLRAFAQIVIGGVFLVKVKLLTSEKGYFLGFPSEKQGDGNYKDTAHPLSAEARGVILNMVLEKYQVHLDEASGF